MDYEDSTQNLLERMLLNASAEPTYLPLSLLKAITKNFSNDLKIGSGGSADVYKGLLRDKTIVMKKLSQAPDLYEKNFRQEVHRLMQVKHKNIVRFLGYCSDVEEELKEHQGEMVFVEVRHRLLCFEFTQNGSLDKFMSDALDGLDWRTRYMIIKRICEGLDYLHQHKIVHLDLKPANILLDHGMVPRIAVFGVSKCFGEKQTRTINSNLHGTLGHMAPESYAGEFTFMSDIYSLGTIITEMLTGRKEYLEINDVLENWRARFETEPGDTWLEHVRLCAEIGMQCTDPNPEKRPTVRHVIERLDEMDRTSGFVETEPCASSMTNVHQEAVPYDPSSIQTLIHHDWKFIQMLEFGPVACIDVHPIETWILVGHHTGFASIWNYKTQEMVMVLQVLEENVRVEQGAWSAKFIAPEQWLVVGDDRGWVHVYSYTTRDKVKEFQADDDNNIITVLDVHPTQSFLLTSSSGYKASIKLWDWGQGWICTREFNKYSGGVYHLTFNPGHPNTFASVSKFIDTIEFKVWNINLSDPVTTFEKLSSERTSCYFYSNSDRHFLLTSVRRESCSYALMWDLRTEELVHELGVRGSILDVACHPTLPILATTVTDGNGHNCQICLLDARTFRLQKIIQLLGHPYNSVVFTGTKDSARLFVPLFGGIRIIEINLLTLKTDLSTGAGN